MLFSTPTGRHIEASNVLEAVKRNRDYLEREANAAIDYLADRNPGAPAHYLIGFGTNANLCETFLGLHNVTRETYDTSVFKGWTEALTFNHENASDTLAELRRAPGYAATALMLDDITAAEAFIMATERRLTEYDAIIKRIEN